MSRRTKPQSAGSQKAPVTADVTRTPAPQSAVRIAPREVHVWRASLAQAEDCLEYFASTLGEEERRRAGRFRFALDRDRYVAGRGLQRAVLSRYLGVSPARLGFQTNEFGKPELAAEQAESGLTFNASNSGTRALYAIAMRRAVGVDLEEVRHLPDALLVARSFFAPREIATVESSAPGAQSLAFLRCWTRKEAYVKAIGEGLSVSLDEFDLSSGASNEPQTGSGSPGRQTQWLVDAPHASPVTVPYMVRELDVGEGFIAALAAEGIDWQLRLFDVSRELVCPQ